MPFHAYFCILTKFNYFCAREHFTLNTDCKSHELCRKKLGLKTLLNLPVYP